MDAHKILKYRYHGGRIQKVSWDFSVNINPLGPPKSFYRLIKENLSTIQFYPEENSETLKDVYAKEWKVKRENLIFGNGASELIFLFINTLNPERIILPIPSFSEYYIASSLKHSELIMPIYKIKDRKFIPPLEKIIDSLSPGSLLIIGNPNNPTGTLYTWEKLITLLEKGMHKRAYIFIDEAFIDFSPLDRKTTILIKEYPNLFILRSFTKIFSIPGIRLGVGIGNPKIVKNMEASKDPWSVNVFAQIIGKNLIKEKKFLEESKKLIIQEKKFIYKETKNLKGIDIFKTDANFYLMKFPHTSSSEIVKFLLEYEIYVRNASNFIGLSDGFIRIAIRNRKENKILLDTIKTLLNNLHPV